MKTFRWSFLALLVALVCALPGVATAGSVSMDFNNGMSGNMPIGAQFVAPSLSSTDNQMDGASGPGSVNLSLSDGGSAYGLVFHSELGNDFQIGSLNLDDGGSFSLSFDSDLSGGFTLSLSNLLPQNGDRLTGFDFVSGALSFDALGNIPGSYPMFTFDGAAGTASFDFGGNVIGGSSFSGTFTAAASAVPEPATTALGLAAVTGLLVALRRRHQKV